MSYYNAYKRKRELSSLRITEISIPADLLFLKLERKLVFSCLRQGPVQTEIN